MAKIFDTQLALSSRWKYNTTHNKFQQSFVMGCVNMDFAKWFSQRIRELRQLEGMTQNEFAEASGIGIATVERIERGKTTPNISTCLLIAQLFGICLSDLFQGY